MSHAPFTLKDDGNTGTDEKHPDVPGRIEIGPGGVEIFFEGHGTCCMQPGKGSLIFIEVYEGRLVMRIWADINSEDPTHVIDLEGSREAARTDEAAVPE